jgi:polyphosphate kinase 2 (PPK2 family)
MPVTGALERYWVKPGSKVDLSKIDSNEKSLFRGQGQGEFEPQFRKLQHQLQDLQKMLYAQNKHRILVVMQAMDTGGKDGCIKHVFSHIDPQGIHVRSFKKPSEEELSYDFLWRVHCQGAARGQLVIFNRSHYEDIIAVRVKKLFPEEVWKRRQRHVIDFERMLAEEGTTIVKIFLHISKEEQKRRLEARLAIRQNTGNSTRTTSPTARAGMISWGLRGRDLQNLHPLRPMVRVVPQPGATASGIATSASARIMLRPPSM